LIASGFDPNTASYIAGHASAAFTVGTYGHAMPESVKAGIAKMGELLQSDRVLELPERNGVVQPSSSEPRDDTRKNKITALECGDGGAPGATRTHDTRFRKPSKECFPGIAVSLQ